MKLGIIGAMDMEVETLLEIMPDEMKKSKAGMDFYEGTLESLPVVVVRCGVGKVNAALCVQILVDTFGVTHILNTGVAGSLNPELDILDLVVSQDAMYHDFDCTQFGYPFGKVPSIDVVAFPADEMLMAVAFAAGEKVNLGHTRIGRIASGDQFISRAEQKQEIIANTKASCTEMEGAGIAQAAYRNAVPFVIIRAISDKADGSDLMDYPTFERIAAYRCAEVARTMAQMLWESENA